MKGFLQIQRAIQVDHSGLFNEEWVQYTTTGSRFPAIQIQKYGDSTMPEISSVRGKKHDTMRSMDGDFLKMKDNMTVKTEGSIHGSISRRRKGKKKKKKKSNRKRIIQDNQLRIMGENEFGEIDDDAFTNGGAHKSDRNMDS